MIRSRILYIILLLTYLIALFIRPIGEGIHFIEHLVSESTHFYHHHLHHHHSDHTHSFTEVLIKVSDQSQKTPYSPSPDNDQKLKQHNLPDRNTINWVSFLLGIHPKRTWLLGNPQNIISPDTPPPKA